MTNHQQGYERALEDVLNLLKPFTQSFKAYMREEDVTQIMTDFNDVLNEINILNGRNQ